MSLPELFKLAGWQSDDGDKSAKAVAEITDQQKLAKIAKEAPHWKARETAIGKLDERHQRLFADIVRNDPSENLRVEAMKKLDESHQALFATIVRGYNSSPLVQDTWSRQRIRMEAIRKMTDKALLADIGKNAKKRDERSEAITRLQAITADGVEDRDGGKNLYAGIAENLYQLLLTDIAKSDDRLSYDESEAAVKRLTDQTLLASVARKAKNSVARQEAIGKLDARWQEVFAEAAKNDESKYVRMAAIRKLDGQHQAALADVAKQNDDDDVSEAAIIKIADQTLLAGVAKNAINRKARWLAFEKLDERRHQALFADLALHDYYLERSFRFLETPGDDGSSVEPWEYYTADLGKAAVKKLTDPSLLAVVAKKAEHQDVREAAEKKLAELAQGARTE
ncbi:MAG: hypothetical protein LBI48_11600 [Burkholderiaceae bacterium]|jgi:hypothetical protein|nr:hypothetical protein [Burkholderiaceae bacterium]